MNITNSPDINTLAFQALFDISLVNPVITLTNYSTGPNLAGCRWWYVVKTPSQTAIHQGSQTAPDMIGVWNTEIVPEAWPQPYGQIEFSGVPYTVQLFVEDSVGNVYSETLSQEICRPLGRTDSNGNFGVASVSMDVNCVLAKVAINDTTSYSYKGNSGLMASKTFIVDYPLDATGSRPPQFTLNNFVNALVPVPYNSTDYTLFLTAVYDYPFSSGITVRVKYKLIEKFQVLCGIDLCPLVCAYDRLISEIENGKCSTGNYAEMKDKMELITAKMVKALIAKAQPACGIDLPKVIEEIKELAGFDCNCYTGNGNNGLIAPGATVNYELDVTCGDLSGSFEEVDGNVILHLADKSYVFAICAGTSDAFEITPTVVGCVKTYCLSVDLEKLKEDLDIDTFQSICVNVYEHGIVPDTAPVSCPGTFYPAYIYDYTNVNVIGYANNSADTIAILNGNATWNVKGIAINAGNCKVCFVPNAGITAINALYVAPDTGNPPPQPSNYAVQVQDYCQAPALQPFNSFPQNIYVSYTNGGTRFFAGHALTYADAITLLNAEPNKPVYITLVAVSNTNPLSITIGVTDANTPANKHVNVFGDKSNVVIIGANGNYGDPANTVKGTTDEVYPDTMARIGSLCGATSPAYKPWHGILYGNIYCFIESDTGAIRRVDVTDPLNPILLAGYSLAGVVTTGTYVPFSGVPGYGGGVPSHWDTYFPTDVNSQTQGSVTYIVESTSATIYKYDIATNTLLGFFYNSSLYGRCPRVIYNDTLYLTLDGNRGALTGVNALQPWGDDTIVLLDLTTFGVSGFIGLPVSGAPSDKIVAMSIDPSQAGVAFITDSAGTVYNYDMNANVVALTYPNTTVSLATAALVNTSIYNQIMYFCAYGLNSYYCALGNLGHGGPVSAVAFTALIPAVGGANVKHFNFVALPNSCYGILTFDNGVNEAGIAKYGLDGTFLGLIPFPGSDYNVVYKYGIPNPTPNTLCP